MSTYSYPRVVISQYAKPRTTTVRQFEDTTILFMPFIAEQGPIGINEEVRTVHNVSELEAVYGELSFESNGETKLVIYNWLNNHGTVLPYRLNNYGTSRAQYSYESDALFVSKHPGEFYNNLKVTVYLRKVEETKEYIKLSIFENSTNILTTNYMLKEEFDNFMDRNSILKLAEGKKFSHIMAKAKDENKETNTTAGTGVSIHKLELTVTNSEKSNATLFELLDNFWDPEKNEYSRILNTLEFPIDVIIDAGYPESIKKNMAKFVKNVNEKGRTDVILLATTYANEAVNNFTGKENLVSLIDSTGKFTNEAAYESKDGKVAFWDQYFLIEEASLDRDIYVTPMYFISKLMPYNDYVYGRQYPLAGLNRGVLGKEVKKIFNVLSPSEKESRFVNRINYCEKSPRNYAFMSQRTFDGSSEMEYTALSFLNNVRTLEKIKKDLIEIGREFLFEYNDSQTIAQLNSNLNKYMLEWVSNRTLSYANVNAYADESSSEKVNISLDISFTNIIETISIDITIE